MTFARPMLFSLPKMDLTYLERSTLANESTHRLCPDDPRLSSPDLPVGIAFPSLSLFPLSFKFSLKGRVSLDHASPQVENYSVGSAKTKKRRPSLVKPQSRENSIKVYLFGLQKLQDTYILYRCLDRSFWVYAS